MKKQKFALYGFLILISILFAACGSPISPPTPLVTRTPTPVHPSSVAVVVSDDFVDELKDMKLAEWLTTLDKDVIDRITPERNCVYIDDLAPKMTLGTSSLGDLPAPHGVLVFEELRSVISRTVSPDIKPIETNGSSQFGLEWIKTILYFENFQDNKTLALVGVDTSNYTTSDIKMHLEETIARLTERGFSRFVVNMSFGVIISCPDMSNPQQTYKDYMNAIDPTNQANEELTSLKTYLSELASGLPDEELALYLAFDPKLNPLRLLSYYNLNKNNEKFYAKYYQVLTKQEDELKELQLTVTPPPIIFIEDPLLAYFREQQSRIIPVAAAGNTGLPYPFAPAIWDVVLSVGAPNYTFPRLHQPQTLTFNSGEVQAEGCTKYENQEFPGTSFAAPKISYLAAVYLLNNGQLICSGDDNSIGIANPVLGYANEEEGDWQNLELKTAIERYCSAFPAPMPNFEPSCSPAIP